MIALVGAMFVSVGPARAAVGDVSATTGYCVEGPGADNTLDADNSADNGDETADNTFIVRATTAADGAPVTIDVPDDGGEMVDGTLTGGRDADDEPDPVNVECSSALAGLPVSVAPDVSGTAIVTAKNATLSVSVNDSDNVVAAGQPDLTVTVRFSNVVQFTHDATLNADDNANNNVGVASVLVPGTTTQDGSDQGVGIDLLWIRVSGELDDPTTPLDTVNWGAAPGAADDNTLTAMLAIPAGTAPGDYTISAAAMYDPNTNIAVTDDDGDMDAADVEKDGTVLTGSVVITVGDPGMNAASADLSLGTATFDTASTVKVETIPEDGTEAASGGDIWLKLVTSNSLDSAANSSGLTGLTIIAPGGRLAIHANNPLNGEPMASAVMGGIGSNSAQITSSVGNTMHILVSKADRKPGDVDVYAQVVGTDGAPRSNTLSLSFTGASSSLTLGTPKSVAPGGKAEFTVDAQDAAGNAGSVGQLSFKVTDADGKGVSTGKVKITKDTAGSSTPEKDTDDNGLQTVGLIETFSTTAPGVYTIETSLAGVKDSKATTTLTVSGAAANVTLDVSMNTDAVELGTIVTVEASVTDKNDAPVADETPISFATGGALTLDKVIAPTETKDGAGTAEFIVSKGEGLGVIIVTSGTGRATHTVSLAAADAMPEEEASVACLSNLAGFATWACGVESSASEIFGLVSGRGATALHLWNGSAWVRYSVVDGTMVPGSSDFMVAENDILYISN